MKISLVVPVFNEAETIQIFYDAVRQFEPLQHYDVEIVFINDGSLDKTGEIVKSLALTDKNIVLLDFTRNFGKESALFAGLEYATGDAVIPIDVDLQDPIEVIPLMIEKWLAGADIVLAKRKDRSSDGRLKRTSAEWFYKLHNKISSPKIEENVGDFRLMSREIVDDIKQLPERVEPFVSNVTSYPLDRFDLIQNEHQPRMPRIAEHDEQAL